MVGNAAWSERESTHVARAYISASENPSKGSDQKAELFWQDVHSRFKVLEAQCDEHVDTKRNVKSVRNQWSTIHHDCSKFLGFFLKLSYEEHSGWSEDDYLLESQNMFLQVEIAKRFPNMKLVDDKLVSIDKENEKKKETDDQSMITSDGDITESPKSPVAEKAENQSLKSPPSIEKLKSRFGFKYLKAFMILKEFDKWSNAVQTKGKKPEKEERPQGQKAAKEESRTEKDLATAHHEIAKAIKQKAKAIDEQTDVLLFSLPNENGVLDEMSIEALRILKKRRLSSLKDS